MRLVVRDRVLNALLNETSFLFKQNELLKVLGASTKMRQTKFALDPGVR